MTNFLSLACDDDAFEAEGLKTPEQILASIVPDDIGTKSIKLEWKEHMRDIPIFRHPDNGSTSEYQPLSYSLFNSYLQRLGRATGFEGKLTLYCIRRGTGNAVNGSQTHQL